MRAEYEENILRDLDIMIVKANTNDLYIKRFVMSPSEHMQFRQAITYSLQFREYYENERKEAVEQYRGIPIEVEFD